MQCCRTLLSALSLLMLPALAGAQVRPADLPRTALLSAYTDMCRIWESEIPAQGRHLLSTDRPTLATCAWTSESQALIRAGRAAQTYDAWSASHPVLTGGQADDATFLSYYRAYMAPFSASGKQDGYQQGNEIREISARDYEAQQYGLIEAQQTSPVRFRMLRLIVADAMRDGRVDAEEFAVIRPVLYDSSGLVSSGALSLEDARQALSDELARTGDAAR